MKNNVDIHCRTAILIVQTGYIIAYYLLQSPFTVSLLSTSQYCKALIVAMDSL